MRLHAVLLILGHSEWGCVLEFYIKPALEEYPVAIKNRKEKPFETAVDESKWAGFFLYIFFFFFLNSAHGASQIIGLKSLGAVSAGMDVLCCCPPPCSWYTHCDPPLRRLGSRSLAVTIITRLLAVRH